MFFFQSTLVSLFLTPNRIQNFDMYRFIQIFSFLACSLCAFQSFAQPKQIVADKVVGVVGDKIVLQSDVENSIIDMQRNGFTLPPNVKCYSLEQALNVKALVLQAEKDSLPITDEEIEIDIDTRIRNYISSYGSKAELEKIAGKTVYQLKEDMTTPIRDQKLAVAMRNKIVNNVRITPYEVQQYFNKIPTDSLPFYETEVEIGEIILYPKASREAEEYAKEELATLKAQVESGRDFKTLANLYSDDPGAKQNYGEYEINRNDQQYDRTWLGKAFTLKEGQVSTPFKTQFGYHIMQLVSRAGDDVLVRHILKIPRVTTFETDDAVKKLDSVRANLISEKIGFGSAVSKYSDDTNGKFTGGMRQGQSGTTFLTIDQLDKDIIPVLDKLKAGEFSQPIVFEGDQGKKGVKIVYLKTRSQPHRENLKEDYSKIAEKALEEKKENVLEKWFGEKLSTYYIKIDPDYVDCDVMEKWVTAAKAHGDM